MTADVFERFTARPWPASQGENPQRTRERRSAMRMVLERFIRGDVLVLNQEIKELGSRDTNLGMRNYWEFRSQGRMTETRLFGFFARPGAFVATDFQPRDIFETQDDWDRQRDKCRATWAIFSGGNSPIQSPWPVQTRAALAAYLNREEEL